MTLPSSFRSLEQLLPWQEKIEALVKKYNQFYFYSADPGASATLRPIYEEAKRQGKAETWFVEGWAAYAYLPNSVRITEQTNFLKQADFSRQAVVMGQQVNFYRAYQRLRSFQEYGLATILISDHWKDIAGIFKPDQTMQVALPDKFFVPDAVAYKVQQASLLKLGIKEEEIKERLEIFIHPAVEESLDKINAAAPAELQRLRTKYSIKGKCITIMLDCINIRERTILGFDWKTALDEAIQCFRKSYPDAKLLVKPHPRQDFTEVKDHLFTYGADPNISMVDETVPELFVALSDEVWGMTTVLLVVALKAGKPIKVFMPGRTEAGARDSNDHIEPFLYRA